QLVPVETKPVPGMGVPQLDESALPPWVGSAVSVRALVVDRTGRVVADAFAAQVESASTARAMVDPTPDRRYGMAETTPPDSPTTSGAGLPLRHALAELSRTADKSAFQIRYAAAASAVSAGTPQADYLEAAWKDYVGDHRKAGQLVNLSDLPRAASLPDVR